MRWNWHGTRSCARPSLRRTRRPSSTSTCPISRSSGSRPRPSAMSPASAAPTGSAAPRCFRPDPGPGDLGGTRCCGRGFLEGRCGLGGILGHAFGAAAVLAQELVEILLAVVVSELLAGSDVAQGEDIDAALADLGLAVGHAGVIDVARAVRARRAVEHLAAAHVEEIARIADLVLLVGKQLARIFDDAGALGDGLAGKQPEPCPRTMDLKRKIARLVTLPRHFSGLP